MCGLVQLGEGEVEFARVMPLVSVRPLSRSLDRAELARLTLLTLSFSRAQEAGKYAQELSRTVNAKLRDA